VVRLKNIIALVSPYKVIFYVNLVALILPIFVIYVKSFKLNTFYCLWH